MIRQCHCGSTTFYGPEILEGEIERNTGARRLYCVRCSRYLLPHPPSLALSLCYDYLCGVQVLAGL